MSWFVTAGMEQSVGPGALSAHVPSGWGEHPWPHALPHALPAPGTAVTAAAGGLASARAGASWRWAESRRMVRSERPQADLGTSTAMASTPPTTLRVPRRVLSTMAAVARTSGRSESEIWTEAAREWLNRHVLDDDPQPPTPAAAALAVPRPVRSWAAIDTVLADLRRPHVTPSAPAA